MECKKITSSSLPREKLKIYKQKREKCMNVMLMKKDLLKGPLD